jgi:gluconolactonase
VYHEELIPLEARVLALGLGNIEGPVVTQAGDIVVASWGSGKLYRVGLDGGVEMLVDTQGSPGGLAEWEDGSIFIAQGGGHKPYNESSGMSGGIQRYTMDGRISWLTKDPVRPSDICIGPDGYLYWTDATLARLDDGRIWRGDIKTGAAELLVSIPWGPNGIGFGVEDDALYVASTMERRIWRFPIHKGTLGRPEVAIQMKSGFPDGFAFDTEGNIVCAMVKFSPVGLRRIGISPQPGDEGPGELQTWTTDGKLLDTFVPGTDYKVTNIAFMHEKGAIVTTIDRGAVLAIDDWPTAGLPVHPFRTRRHSTELRAR